MKVLYGATERDFSSLKRLTSPMLQSIFPSVSALGSMLTHSTENWNPTQLLRCWSHLGHRGPPGFLQPGNHRASEPERQDTLSGPLFLISELFSSFQVLPKDTPQGVCDGPPLKA